MQINLGLGEFLSSLPLAVIFADAAGLIRDSNPATARIFGYSREELHGQPVEILIPDAIRSRHVKLREDYLRAPSVRPMGIGRDLLGRRKNGEEFPIEVSLHPITTQEGISVAAIITDITERKRGENERRTFDAQVQERQKLESLGLMASGVAHDFNNLLAVILGNSALALRKFPGEPNLTRYIEQIQQAAARAAELSSQLLAYSGHGRFVVGSVALSQVVEEMASLLEASIADRRATLHRKLSSDVPTIHADIVQIRQILLNLVINASESLVDGRGLITISTGRQRVDDAYARNRGVAGAGAGLYGFLEVSDTGRGMDRETRSRVLEPFFSTKGTGRGLGLAAVSGIARGHGGFVRIYSEVGQGTSVKVLFPAIDDATPTLEEEAAPVPSGEPRRLILVVDDEVLLAEMVREILESEGFTVLVAHGGREALVLFRSRAADIDCVVLDMVMPDMTGSDVFRELKEIRPDIRVILSSGFSEQEAVGPFLGRGLSGFLRKPFDDRELMAKVRAVLLDAKDAGNDG